MIDKLVGSQLPGLLGEFGIHVFVIDIELG